MKKIYDNGEILLGEVKKIKEYTLKQFIKGLIDEEFKTDVLNDLKDFKDNTIVAINYDNGMGYSIDYWDDSDVIEEQEKRCCNECKKEMDEGYCIESGLEYYCSDECLHKNISEEEYLRLYDNGNGDTYWTQWEE